MGRRPGIGRDTPGMDGLLLDRRYVPAEDAPAGRPKTIRQRHHWACLDSPRGRRQCRWADNLQLGRSVRTSTSDIGKSLAIVSDARFNGENIGVVVERLLCISGEDTLTVDRKFLGSVTMKLPTRFVFLTNELPRMNDSSTALAGRFIILRLTHSFYGKENMKLTSELMEELPGILLWAIEGLKRLRTRGHFVQPRTTADAVREMEDLASPVLAFVRECCIVEAGERTWVDALYSAWKSWCERDGRTIVTSKQTFGRDLAAAAPGVTRRRGAGDVPFYEGIALKGGTT